MGEAINEAKLEVKKLKNVFDVYILADSALNGSKTAYIQLKAIAVQKTDHGIAARGRLVEIQKSLLLYRQSPTFYQGLVKKTDNEQVPYENLSLDEIVDNMVSPTLPDNYRHVCMVYIKNKPREEIFKKALQVLHTSDSLLTCAAFCGVLSEISDNKAAFLDFEGWIKICENELKSNSRDNILNSGAGNSR